MHTERVRFSVEWLVPMSQARSITLALQAVANATRSDAGCVSCLVSTDFQHAGNVRYTEEWATEEALRQRTHARSFVPLARLIRDVSRSPRIACTRNGDDVLRLTKDIREAARSNADRQLLEDRADTLFRHHARTSGTRAATTH